MKIYFASTTFSIEKALREEEREKLENMAQHRLLSYYYIKVWEWSDRCEGSAFDWIKERRRDGNESKKTGTMRRTKFPTTGPGLE